MFGFLLAILFLLSFGVFALPRKHKALYAGAITLLVAVVAAIPCFDALLQGEYFEAQLQLPLAPAAQVGMDKLSAFFTLTTCLIFLVSAFYSFSYFQKNGRYKTHAQLSLHLLFQVQLLFALIAVLVARNAFVFLFAWEYMAICSFVLLIFNGQVRSRIRTAITFFVQMHVGFFLLLFAFAMVENATGSFSFGALAEYFSGNPNLPVFLLFFVAFGIKSGFVPLHTWLPETYAQLPPTFGGVMSGAVTGMGIYGLLRVLTFVQTDFLAIASTLLVVAMFTTIYGICMAAIQKDIKRLLGYSSIENMGIVGIGMGLGMLGQSAGNDFLMITGFSGALLHVFSHAVVKSLLFFSVGDVCSKLGTQNLERMGGLMRLMPRTSLLFLCGAMAICALPPFMGFVSEFVLYSGVLGSLRGWGYSVTGFGVATLAVLSAAGGIAVLTFSKALGVGFLGQSRSSLLGEEERSPALYAMLALLGIALLLGVYPVFFVKIAYQVVAVSYPIPDAVFIRHAMEYTLSRACVAIGVMVGIAAGIFFLRRCLFKKRRIAEGETWACGATTTAPRVQYTAGSYSGEFAALTRPFNGGSRRMDEPIAEGQLFAPQRKFRSVSHDIFRRKIRPGIRRVSIQMNKLAIFQTGRVHHYILYALLFMILIFLMTYFKFI
ncbi:MAG: hypothetical protein LBU92_02410 [Prevotellaceae bacterium]|jgi:formate hydrogenlyase subunit 3/multisubunit Na+/H+ antiporter MnhD subunit|nr:hypothetical protein [Prevotellaceae bacterium]